MQKFEDILNTGLQRIKNSEDISSVLADLGKNMDEAQRNNLSAMLQISASISSLPRKQAPTPIKRYLYAEYQPNQSQLASKVREFFATFKTATVVLGAFALLIAGTAFGAAKSLPGDPLFALKRAYENTRVQLASNAEIRASLQIQYANQRIDEAKQILAENDRQKTDAAIQAVNQQTSIALTDVKQAVKSGQNQSAGKVALVTQAEQLAQTQNNIVATADPSAALLNQQQNTAAIQEIKNIVAVSNEESGTKLQPANIDLSGIVSSMLGSKITVNTNSFIIDPVTTKVTDRDGNSISTVNIEVGDNVKIKGTVNANQNSADSITISNKLKQIVNGQITVVKIQPTQTETVNSTDSQTPAPDQSQPIIPVKPQDTHGGFIPEPPGNF